MPLQLNLDVLHKGVYKSDKTFTVKIKLLDNTIISLTLPQKAKGKDCLDKIAQSLCLEEINYFGLQYTNKKHQARWIEMNKMLKKQLERNCLYEGKDAVLLFRIHFYATDCQKLKQEITRYLYYLQLKNDIIQEALKCREELAFMLASYAVQAEFGDFDEEKHALEFIEDFVLLPPRVSRNYTQEEINEKILVLHQKHSGMSPAAAEMTYISLCQQIDAYGVEMFSAKDKHNADLNIGASFLGIKVKPSNYLPVVYFKWQDISNMSFNKQYFCIESITTEETIQFETSDTETAKFIWRECIAQHQFFRLSHSTLRSPNFRTQHEIVSDSKITSRTHEERPFQRKVTLTLKEGRQRRERANDTGATFGICNAAFNDIDSEDGLTTTQHENNDIIAHNVHLSVRSKASSGYDSSESGSDCGSLSFNPIALNSNARSDPGSSSPSANTLRRQKKETRDLMLKQLEKVIEQDQVYVEFEEVFLKKLNCNLTSASLLLNAEKNRNKEILPYEENRIILDCKTNKDRNDYINASYIKMEVGKGSVAGFIVAQCPLKNTAHDFWQMIWEQNTCLCVLISKEMDKDDPKTFRYWPNDVPESRESFGDFCIETKFVNSSNLCLTRGFKLTNLATEEARDVYQIQYTDWPQTGVPEDPMGFVDFLEEVRSMHKSLRELTTTGLGSNLLVHCSNGAGKSGVFVLCETLIRLMENNQKFDIPMTLARLRTQRMYLIETVAQYRFAYLVVIQYLKRNRLI